MRSFKAAEKAMWGSQGSASPLLHLAPGPPCWSVVELHALALCYAAREVPPGPQGASEPKSSVPPADGALASQCETFRSSFPLAR